MDHTAFLERSLILLWHDDLFVAFHDEDQMKDAGNAEDNGDEDDICETSDEEITATMDSFEFS